MSNPVTITIDVIDNDSSGTIQQVTANLAAIGPAGEAAGAQAAAGLDKIAEHSMGAREEARLMNEELHLGMSRAMLGVVADTNLLAGAIGAIGPALIGIGAVGIIAGIGKEVYNLYEKWFDVDAVTAEYQKKLDDAAQKEFLNPQNVQMALTNLQQVNEQLDALNAKKDQSAATWGGFLGAGERYTPGDETKRTGLLGQQSQLEENATKDSNRSLDNGIAQMEKFVNATEKGYKQIADLKGLADKKTAQQFNEGKFGDQNKDFAAAYDRYKDALIDNETESAGKIIALHTGETAQIIAMQNSARNAELSGMALLEAQKEHALEDFKSKYGTSRAAIDAIDEEYNNKEMALWNQQWEAADKAMRTAQQAAQQAAHIGVGSIENERQNSLSDIKGDMDPDAANEMKAAANLTSNTRILAAQHEFETQMQQVGTHADDAQISGYARIADEAAKSAQKIQSDWQTLEDKVGSLSTAAVDAQLEGVSAVLGTYENMLREMGQAHAKTMDQISKEEEQTARYSLPQWQQAQLKIVDAYQDRVREITEAEHQQTAALNADMQQDANNAALYKQAEVMNELDADAKKLAAYQEMNAQKQQSDEETRDKLASGLQSLFNNPTKFFEDTAMKAGFQLMANEMLSVFQSSGTTGGVLQFLFGMGPEMSTDKNPLKAFGSELSGGHGHGAGGLTGAASPGTIQFQQGSSLLLSGSQMLVQAASAVQALGTGGGSGMGLTGMGNGGFGMMGSTTGGAGMSVPSIPGSSTGSGMVGSSPMPQTTGDIVPGSFGADGNFNTAATSGSGTAGAMGGIAGGALMGATSIYGAYTSSNPIAGAAGGAMGGMEAGGAIGGLVGGPAGALLGGAIGAIAGGIGGLLAGIFGDQGRGQAEGLDVNTVQPALLKDMQDYEAGRSGYSAIASNLENMLISAQTSTATWGSGARNYFNSNIQPEINSAMSSLQKQEVGGRSNVTLSAGQYHSGGMVGGFGDLATSDTEGFIHARQNEFVMNPGATAAHAPILQAMNSGTNFGYSGTAQPRMPASSSGSGSTITINALDAKSVAQWAAAGGGRMLVSAVNIGQRQYSGKGR